MFAEASIRVFGTKNKLADFVTSDIVLSKHPFGGFFEDGGTNIYNGHIVHSFLNPEILISTSFSISLIDSDADSDVDSENDIDSENDNDTDNDRDIRTEMILITITTRYNDIDNDIRTQKRVCLVAVADIHATILALASTRVFGTEGKLSHYVTSEVVLRSEHPFGGLSDMVARISATDT